MRMSTIGRSAIAAAALSVSVPAFAGLSPVGSPFGGEPALAQILTDLYGSIGGTVVADGVNFKNDEITFTRVDDDLDQTIPDDLVFDFLPPTGYSMFDHSVSFVDDVFVLEGNPRQFFSVPEMNLDDSDHMITFRFDGPNLVNPGYVFFFEDWDNRFDSDFDYNDHVLANPAVIPLPAAVVAGGAMLSLLAGARAALRRA